MDKSSVNLTQKGFSFINNAFGQLGLGDNLNRGGMTNLMGNLLPVVTWGTGADLLNMFRADNHNCVVLR